MPRPARPWFRLYVETLHDPKLRRLPPAQRWVWVAVLGAARQSCHPGILLVSEREPMDEHDLADLAATPVKEVRKALEAMEASGMVVRDPAGIWSVPKWNERQFETDNTTERTRKHRSNEQRRNVPTSSVGTPPESETETDTYRRRLVTHDANGTRPDDDDLSTEIPDDVWTHYAELKLGQQHNIRNPGPWKQRTATNARTELADQAGRWWHDYELTPYRLAQALVAGTVPAHTPRRNGTTPT